MAGSPSDYLENAMLNHFSGKLSVASVTPIYLALCTVAPTDSDTGSTITEATYTGYARKSVAAADFNAPAGGVMTNANVITFADCTAGSSTIVGWALCDAATLGNVLWAGDMTSVTVNTTNTPPRVPAGSLSLSQT